MEGLGDGGRCTHLMLRFASSTKMHGEQGAGRWRAAKERVWGGCTNVMLRLTSSMKMHGQLEEESDEGGKGGCSVAEERLEGRAEVRSNTRVLDSNGGPMHQHRNCTLLEVKLCPTWTAAQPRSYPTPRSYTY